MIPINVFYDHQIFSLQQFGGVSRYFSGLINEYQGLDSIKVNVGGIFSDNHYLKNIENFERISLPHCVKKGRTMVSFLLNSIYDNLNLKNNNFDIYHPTYYHPYFLRKQKPYVVTVYDMIHEKFPQHFSKRDQTSYCKKKLVENSSRIISISENTKKDLIEIFSIPPEKIDVVYLSSDLKYNFSNEVNNTFPKNYILFVGSRGGYKNFSRFIEAIGNLFSKINDISLVLGGGGRLSKSEMENINKLGISDRVIQKNLSDQELISAYTKATCFVFPSLYEGFGLPILEAFQCKCPVVLSDSSSFPEVAAEAGIYFDPYSIDAIENVISRIIKDDALRSDLRIKGTERLKYFTQKKVAEETLTVYRRAV